MVWCLQELNVPRPMITVCPGHLNLRDLAVSYFGKHMDEAEENLPLEDMARHALVKRRVLDMWDRNVAPLAANRDLNPLEEECFGAAAKNNTSSKCDFLRHLYAMYETRFFDKCNNIYEDDLLVDYVTENIVTRTRWERQLFSNTSTLR